MNKYTKYLRLVSKDSPHRTRLEYAIYFGTEDQIKEVLSDLNIKIEEND